MTAVLRDLHRQVQREGASELLVPREGLARDDIPLLGTGKTDHPTLQSIVEERASADGALTDEPAETT